MNGDFSNYKRGKLDYKQYTKDLSFGMKSEKSVMEILKEEYGDKIQKTKGKWDKMDYYLLDDNDKICRWFELKSRRVQFGKYPSLCFNKSKLDFAMKQNVPTTILFNCLDGIIRVHLLCNKYIYCSFSCYFLCVQIVIICVVIHD